PLSAFWMSAVKVAEAALMLPVVFGPNVSRKFPAVSMSVIRWISSAILAELELVMSARDPGALKRTWKVLSAGLETLTPPLAWMDARPLSALRISAVRVAEAALMLPVVFAPNVSWKFPAV